MDMKHCPQCRRPYEDIENYCLQDGYMLVSEDVSRFDPQADTLVMPESQLINPEAALGRAAELDRKLRFKSERRGWYYSEKGVTSTRVEVDNLHRELERLVRDINSKSEQLQIELTKTGENCMLFSRGIGLNVNWSGGIYRYANTLEGWGLSITAFDQAKFIGGILRQSKMIHEEAYEPDMDENYQIGWRKKDQNKQMLTSNELANKCLDVL